MNNLAAERAKTIQFCVLVGQAFPTEVLVARTARSTKMPLLHSCEPRTPHTLAREGSKGSGKGPFRFGEVQQFVSRVQNEVLLSPL